ncbi:MAG: aldehyde dehydrogenase family protein, partial [Acidobacteriota bacterium]|nr:aldehyde dehydrogenase family protein [Acidobacteriota bacterium]
MSTLPEFRNEPLTDFNKPENKAAMDLAIAKVLGEIGREHPIVIGGERITGLKTFKSLNPAHKDQVVGLFQEGSAEHVERAIEVAWNAFESWKRAGVEAHAGLLLRAAKLMRERKHEFSAVMVLEVGKTWAEADADTAEAIDFMEFYAREAIRYSGEHPVTQIESEENALVY